MQLVLHHGTQQFNSWPEACHKVCTNTHSKPACSLCVKNTQAQTPCRDNILPQKAFVRYLVLQTRTFYTVFLESPPFNMLVLSQLFAGQPLGIMEKGMRFFQIRPLIHTNTTVTSTPSALIPTWAISNTVLVISLVVTQVILSTSRPGVAWICSA